MANRPRTSASAWVEIGYEVLGTSGLEGVRIDDLAAKLGVAKSGFYHRFADRQALLDALVERWIQHGDEHFERASSHADPEARLRAIGYNALIDDQFRRVESWLLLHDPADPALAERSHRIREQSLAWAEEQFVEVGFDPAEAARRAYVYYVGYLGLVADLEARAAPTGPDEVHRLVDSLVDLVVGPTKASLRRLTERNGSRHDDADPGEHRVGKPEGVHLRQGPRVPVPEVEPGVRDDRQRRAGGLFQGARRRMA